MTTIRKAAFNLAVCIFLAAFSILPGQQAHAATADQPYWTTKPCKFEDSVNCHWDAGSSGNGKGHSFSVRYVPGAAHMTCVFYAQRHYAKKHDYCTGDDVLDTRKAVAEHPDFDADGYIE